MVKAISKISQFIFFGNRAGVGIHLYSVNLTDFRVIIETRPNGSTRSKDHTQMTIFESK